MIKLLSISEKRAENSTPSKSVKLLFLLLLYSVPSMKIENSIKGCTGSRHINRKQVSPMRVRPFRAIRPESCEVDKIASLPYDILDEEEARQLAEDNEKSFLRIERAEIDLPEYAIGDDEQILERAKKNLQEFLSNGWLLQDDKPGYYLYRLRKDDRALYGLVMTVAVEDYVQGKILRLEQTLPDQESQRFYLNTACDAHTSPVTLGYQDQDELEEQLSRFRSRKLPLYTFDSFYDVEHCVWKIDDKQLNETITRAFAADAHQMYILDGHQRMEAAAQVAERRQAEAGAMEEDECQFVLAVAFPLSQVKLQSYHRLVRGRLQAPEWRKIRENFTVTEVEETDFQPQSPRLIGMFDGQTFYHLKPKEDVLQGEVEGEVDAALLQEWILRPVFGIAEPFTDKRLSFFGGGEGLETLLQRAQERSSIAFALSPPAGDQLIKAAESGEVLPPKSVWFEPKVLSGIFLHALETKAPHNAEKEMTFEKRLY